MTETPGSYAGKTIPQPSHRPSSIEQLELLLWHPLFTGKCPRCGEVFVHLQPPANWQCGCGWKELTNNG